MKRLIKKSNLGFTLIELLVVVAIIGVLVSIVLVSSGQAKNKGSDGGVKANLRNAIAQAEVFYITNSVAPNTYTNVCSSGQVGGVYGIGSYVLTAAKANGLPSFTTNGTGTLTTATCNDSVGAWAVEVPLRSQANTVWCVDSQGKSIQESTSIGAGTACS